jgi:hypoxanthine phosphoribosyltransferase
MSSIAATTGKSSQMTQAQIASIPATYASKIDHVLFSEEQLQARIVQLAAEISASYSDPNETILVVGLLKGAFLAVADVAKRLTVPNKIDFLVASSYGGTATTSSGTVRLKKDLDIDPANKHILIVEDLIDTGNTLAWVKSYLLTKNCKSVKICCILDKKERREVDLPIDFVGFVCPDEFVVGYGMDFDEEFRTLPFVGVLKPECYGGGKE